MIRASSMRCARRLMRRARLLPIAGADHFTILDELRRPDGELVRAAQRLIEDVSH